MTPQFPRDHLSAMNAPVARVWGWLFLFIIIALAAIILVVLSYALPAAYWLAVWVYEAATTCLTCGDW